MPRSTPHRAPVGNRNNHHPAARGAAPATDRGTPCPHCHAALLRALALGGPEFLFGVRSSGRYPKRGTGSDCSKSTGKAWAKAPAAGGKTPRRPFLLIRSCASPADLPVQIAPAWAGKEMNPAWRFLRDPASARELPRSVTWNSRRVRRGSARAHRRGRASPRMTLLVILPMMGSGIPDIFHTVQHDLPYNRNDEPKRSKASACGNCMPRHRSEAARCGTEFSVHARTFWSQGARPCRHPFGAACQPGVGGAMPHPGMLQRRPARPMQLVANDTLPFNHASARCMNSESPA